MKVISLYCGAGGIDEGLKQAGIETTLAVDMVNDCCETIKLNHPECETITSKIKDVKDSLGKADIIVGGPPCPEFSRANTERSFDSSEVDLFWEIVRELKPKKWLMENVQDVIQICKERNFLVNCANYGTPQTRIRRFFTNLIKPKYTHARVPSSDLFGNSILKWVSVKDALGIKGIIEDRKVVFDEEKFRQYGTENPSHTIHTDQRDFFISSTGHPKQNRHNITRSVLEPVDTIVVAQSYQITSYPIYSQKYLKYKNPVIFKKHPPQEWDQPCTTIKAKDRATPDEYVTDKTLIRKLTNSELAILQGFSKEYRFFGNKSSVRRQIGNAVPPQPVRALFA